MTLERKLEKRNARKLWHASQTAKGLCRHCNRPVKIGRKHCEWHLAYGTAQFRLKKYGITQEQYDALLVSQQNGCAICGNHRGKMQLAVDHDHITGTVRGILCHSCNNGLGRFKENIELLSNAIRYLETYALSS